MLPKNIPSFAPRGVIGRLVRGEVLLSDEFRRYLDNVLRTRIESLVTRSGTIIETNEEGEPEGWLLLNGQQVDASLYPTLAGIYGSTGGLITLPDRRNTISMGAGSIVANMQTAGSTEATLTAANNGPHVHPITDRGHTHGAVDRGHSHKLHIDSHSHDVTEVEGSEHTHPITDKEHAHGRSARRSANNVVASGSDEPSVLENDTDDAFTGITETETPDKPLELAVSEAEVSGSVLKSRANIRVNHSKSNVSIAQSGEGAPFSILNPVFGVNYLVKT